MKRHLSTHAPTLIACLLLVALLGCGARDAPSRPDAGNLDGGGDGDAQVRDMDTPPSQIGESCSGPGDCVSEAACIGTVSEGFICMAYCDVPYSACADDSVCTPVSNGGTAICYIGGELEVTDPCTSNLQCAPGLLCFGSSPSFFCRSACDSPTGSGCLPGEYCRILGTGAAVCRNVLGAACVTDEDCPASGQRCSEEIDDAWRAAYPGGYCSTICMFDEDCSIGSHCAEIDGSTTRLCIKECTHVSECRFNESYECVDASECATRGLPALCEDLTAGATACLK